jgi:hypothetical protein
MRASSSQECVIASFVYWSIWVKAIHQLDSVHFTFDTIMRTKALIHHFHDLQPIYSAHFEPGAKGRLATAGGDNNVRVSYSAFSLFLDLMTQFGRILIDLGDRYGKFTSYRMEKSKSYIFRHWRDIRRQ